MELGKRIAKIRKENKLTQEDLAEICSVTRQTISNWENGKSYPDLETLVLISDTFDVSLDAMMKGDRKMVSEMSKEQKHGRLFAVKIIVAILIAAAIILGGLYYIEAHESYIPYEEAGITVTDNGAMYTDRNYSCYYGCSYVTETVGDENHLIEFIYLTSSFYSRHFDKRHDTNTPIAFFGEASGKSLGGNGRLLDDIVTEVYYLPEKYVVEQGLLEGKHSQLIPMGASEMEVQEIIQQIKADSFLLWKQE